ncbi:MAG: ribosomal protein L7/L12 [Rhodospirillales bacterium]|nr:MAG: ribosomal protein L7/L12 [Rhodospirillales bacterium]
MGQSWVVVAAVGAGVVVAIVALALLLRGRGRAKVLDAQAFATPSPAGEDTPVASLTMAAADSILRAKMARGEKIEAIKMVRDITGLGLKEAKDYVDAMPNVPSLNTMARRVATAPPPPPPGDPRAEATTLVAEGRLMEAVKLVRERTGMGLKEAKDYVDALRFAPRGPSPLDDPKVRASLAGLISAGREPEAMDWLRQRAGMSIEAAKHHLDTLRPR